MLLDTHISMPSQDPLAENKFSLHPRDLRKWIKNLPYVDQDAASKQFYDGLKRSNRQAHATKQRLAAIDIMRPVAHEFLQHQRKYLIAQPFPLSKKATEVLKLQQNILNELAVAYKIVTQETVNRDGNLGKKKLVECVHYAMYYQMEQYITLAQVYSEPPQSYWHDLCQLYGIAEHFKLTEIQLKNTIDDENKKSTPRNIFIRACLLSLANLHAYGHGEAEKIAKYISNSASLVGLTDKNSKESNYIFYINLALRKPVRLLPDEEVPLSSKNRYIDASALVEELKDFCKTESNDTSTLSKNIDQSLANRLLQKLTSKPIRSSKRAVPPKGRLHIVMGLRDAIEILHSGPEYQGTNQTENINNVNRANLELLPIENHLNFAKNIQDNSQVGNELSSSDAWDWVGRGNVITEQVDDNSQATAEEDTNKNVTLNPVIQTWDISNASKGGYCITSNNTSDYQSQVGDLILLRLEDKSNDRWRLGVIRWMQSLNEEGVKIGLEILHGSIEALKVIDAHLVSERDVDFDRILLITQQADGNIENSIITPPHAVTSGDSIIVQHRSRRLHFSFKQIQEKTISFARFTFDEMPDIPNGDEI